MSSPVSSTCTVPLVPPRRPLTGYFFEDYRVGQHFYHATPRTVTDGDVALYIALTGARQPLHCAETVAQRLGYPRCPVDDLLVFNMAFGKTVPDISYNAVANLGYADCRFLRPVYVGDTLRCETQIIGLKENSSGKTGVVYVRSQAYNQRDETLLTWARWVMIHKRDSATATTAAATATAAATTATVPDFLAKVVPETLATPAFIRPRELSPQMTGSDRFWDDYQLTETIKHPMGMTLDETDHALATRLYQNTARVHVDLHHMQGSRFGRRLVYGGHVISICRALSYDGLENLLSIVAINSGQHSNPVFAGDTIYAMSTVAAKWPINDELGALQLTLTGIKNIDPNSTHPTTFTDSSNLIESHSEAVVLSLNYTVLMPRRSY